ncbi:hypothetical protein V5799_013241 [Amblyomma americanum]|uniref:Uncharacterized protein n=1 Tax=Amblyomma americanum TaxID=6943 RepID=A0AAQ4E6G5_AMBAM
MEVQVQRRQLSLYYSYLPGIGLPTYQGTVKAQESSSGYDQSYFTSAIVGKMEKVVLHCYNEWPLVPDDGHSFTSVALSTSVF